MRILFQGDSITDCQRNREDPLSLGGGYPKFAAEALREKYPGADFTFYNRGIGGENTDGLLGRLQPDFLDLEPDIVSILIGINDAWYEPGHGGGRISHRQYEANYRKILEALRDAGNPKIIMLEPFFVGFTAKNHVYSDLYQKILLARRLAHEFADAYIPLDGLFASAILHDDPLAWSDDAVHLTEKAARFVACHYVSAIAPLVQQLL